MRVCGGESFNSVCSACMGPIYCPEKKILELLLKQKLKNQPRSMKDMVNESLVPEHFIKEY